MSKITLNSVGSLIDVTTAQTAINNNFNIIQTAMDNTLSRDGTSPNTIGATIDMNSNRLTNLPEPIGGSEPLRLQDAELLNGGGTINTVPVGGNTNAVLSKNSAANYDMVWSDSTGTGNVVRSTSPTLVTPALGTPSAAVLTNATGLPVSTGISGLGTGVATFLATPSSANLRTALTDETGTGSAVFATSPTLVTPVLGTPTSGTLTNCTGLPIATGVSGLGTGMANFLVTPSSANLRSTVTDETGTGALYFQGGDIGTPSAGVATNITGLNATNLSTGTVNEARLANYGTPTVTTTPTVAAGSGTITAASTSLRYQTRGKQTWFTLTVTITTNGTGATSVIVNGLPWTFGSDCVVCGRATAGSGKMIQGYAQSGTSSMTIFNYDNTYPAISGEVLKLTGVVENT